MVYDVRALVARVIATGLLALVACAPEQAQDYGVYAGPAIAEPTPRVDGAVVAPDEATDAGRDAGDRARVADAGIDAGRRADCGVRRHH